MRELRPRVSPRLGVLGRPRLRRFAGLLAHGRREAWPPHGLALVLARRPRTFVAGVRVETQSNAHRWSRIERLVLAASPALPGRAGVRGADGVSRVARERLELRLRERSFVVHTARARVERSSLRLERAGAELVVRQ